MPNNESTSLLDPECRFFIKWGREHTLTFDVHILNELRALGHLLQSHAQLPSSKPFKEKNTSTRCQNIHLLAYMESDAKSESVFQEKLYNF